MATKTPTEQEVLDYFKSLSNWGRWGKDDQLGTRNHITPEKTKRAAQLVSEGVTISAAREIVYDAAPDVWPFPPIHYMLESGEQWASGNKVSAHSLAGSMDFIGVAFHGMSITHMDSLAHIFWDGKMYNGWPAHLISTSLGATVESIDLLKDGIVSRGVLVDVPMIRGTDWVERAKGCGFRVEEGDVLLIRTGQLKRRNVEGPVSLFDEGSTACQAACLPLFHERSIAVLGSDTGNDVIPAMYPNVPNPIHQVGIVGMGLWILDNADFEDLAQACQQRNRWEFLISINPLRLHNGTGSPVNPVVTF